MSPQALNKRLNTVKFWIPVTLKSEEDKAR